MDAGQMDVLAGKLIRFLEAGDWDEARQAEHAAAVPLIRP